MEELLLPSKNDALFREFSDESSHMVELKSGITAFFRFSESYKLAGQELFKIIDETRFYANILAYPIVFLHRQFLELRLKELINCLNFICYQQRSFPNGHNLQALWEDYLKLMKQAGDGDSLDNEVFKSAEKLILEFDFFDPQSYSFRYPVDKKPERNPTIILKNLDIDNFKFVIRKLIHFFDSQIEWIYHLEALTEEMISSYLREYEMEVQREYERQMDRELEREMQKEYEREMNRYYS